MFKQISLVVFIAVAAMTSGCATNLGTGSDVMADLQKDFPITVGRLVEAHMDTGHRLRVYLELCEDASYHCLPNGPRMLAMVESNRKSILERIARRYLEAGKDQPIYVYGPMCTGLEEMVLVPRCQSAVAIGIYDPHLDDYIVYSTLHGSGSVLESEGFAAFMRVMGGTAKMAKKALF